MLFRSFASPKSIINVREDIQKQYKDEYPQSSKSVNSMFNGLLSSSQSPLPSKKRLIVSRQPIFLNLNNLIP